MSTNYEGVLARINTVMQLKSVSRTELADRIGVDRSTVNSWFTGRTKSYMKYINEIAEATGVPAIFILMGGESNDTFTFRQPEASNLKTIPATKRVPLVGTIACGEPILAVENVVDFVTAPLDVNADMALVCKGDSMTGARIMDGDVVYIRQQPEVENGEIAAVLVGDEATLKRVFIKGNHVILAPCNPAYDVMVYTGDEVEQVHIIGKAVAFTSTVR